MDKQEIEALYQKYSYAIYKRAQSFMKNEEEALEVMQEVFVKALQYADSFRGESSPYTWLYRIATHLCLNKLRHIKITKIVDEPLEETRYSSGHNLEKTVVNQKAFYKIFDQLEKEDQTILTLYFVDGLTQEQVAQSLSLSRKTIYHRLKNITDLFKEQGLNDGI